MRKVRSKFIEVSGGPHCVYFSERAPENWWDVLDTHDFDFDKRYRLGLIEGGIYTFPLACKQSSVSFAHTEADIDEVLDVLKRFTG